MPLDLGGLLPQLSNFLGELEKQLELLFCFVFFHRVSGLIVGNRPWTSDMEQNVLLAASVEECFFIIPIAPSRPGTM